MLTQRDYFVLRIVHKFRFCLGRHLQVLAGFSGQRATDRRLLLLLEGGYLRRKKYLYGLPYLYTLTHKGRLLLAVNKRAETIRVDRITHDINVVEAVIFYIDKYKLHLEEIESEKELHIKDGFGKRQHQPDFVFTHEGNKYAVEIELNLKSKDTHEKNVKANYLNYDIQIWVTDDKKVRERLQGFMNAYGGIEIQDLKGVKDHVRI